MSTNTTARPGNLAAALDDPERAQLRPCACSFVHVEGEDLRCTRTTKRTFAPGHDAQLKSRLIHAVVNGLTVREVGEDGKLRETTAALAAGKHGFGYQVAAGVARAQRLANEKAARKAARDLQREANRAAREAAKADAAAKREAAKQITAKVGRWEVTGTVAKDGSLTYTNKKGEEKTAPKGKWAAVPGGAA